MLKQRVREQAYKVVSVVMLGTRDETAVLALAASLARTVDEALSVAILETVSESNMTLRNVEHVDLITDEGVAGSVDRHAVALGNSAFLAGQGLSVGSFGEWAERTASDGEAVIFVAVDRQPAGVLRVSTNF